ncbi:two-component response regulator [Streptomyces sp. NBRC 110611]|nr:two-component response regulator [Streptomyces sp. NBRC 110611]
MLASAKATGAPVERSVPRTETGAVNRSHAKIRTLVEQAIATLTFWRILRKPRCSTTRITTLIQAVLTLHRLHRVPGSSARRGSS